MPCSRSPGDGIPACLAGGIPACLAAGLQGVFWPTPWGGEVEGSGQGGLQAHTGGGVSRPTLGEGSPGPHLGGVSQHALRQTPPWTATAMGGTHPTGIHSCSSL